MIFLDQHKLVETSIFSGAASQISISSIRGAA